MTEQEEYKVKVQELLKNKSFILDNSKEFTPLAEYIDFFSRRYEQKFLYFVPPCLYNINLLDHFKDNIVYTTHLANNQGRAPQLYTLVQLDTATHLYLAYVYMENRFSIGIEIYTSNPQSVLEFMDKYAELEQMPEEKKQGF